MLYLGPPWLGPILLSLLTIQNLSYMIFWQNMETFHLYFITLLSWLPVHLFQWWDGHGPAKNHSELSRISSAQEYWTEAPPGVKSRMKCKNYLPNICKPQCILSFCPLSSWASLGDCRGQSPSRSCCRSLSLDTSSPYHQPPPAAPGDITLAPEGNNHCQCQCQSPMDNNICCTVGKI